MNSRDYPSGRTEGPLITVGEAPETIGGRGSRLGTQKEVREQLNRGLDLLNARLGERGERRLTQKKDGRGAAWRHKLLP